MAKLKNILKQVAKLLQKAKKENKLMDYALIGGFAVSARALPRSTKDIDFLIETFPSFYKEDLPQLLKNSVYTYKVFQSDFTDPINGLIRLYDKSGNELVDLIPVFWKWHQEVLKHSEEIEIEKGIILPVARAEDLIVLKLKAGGPQDLLDIQSLLSHSPIDLVRLKSLAKMAKVDKKLERILKKE